MLQWFLSKVAASLHTCTVEGTTGEHYKDVTDQSDAGIYEVIDTPLYDGMVDNPQYGGMADNPQYGSMADNPQYGVIGGEQNTTTPIKVCAYNDRAHWLCCSY